MFDRTPKSFDVDSEEEEEEEIHLVWYRKGVWGVNATNKVVHDLEAIDVVPETKLNNDPTKN